MKDRFRWVLAPCLHYAPLTGCSTWAAASKPMGPQRSVQPCPQAPSTALGSAGRDGGQCPSTHPALAPHPPLLAGCAFVVYDRWSSCEAAIAGLNGKTHLEGAKMPLVVKFADAKVRRCQACMPQKQLPQQQQLCPERQHPGVSAGGACVRGGGGGSRGREVCQQGGRQPGVCWVVGSGGVQHSAPP